MAHRLDSIDIELKNLKNRVSKMENNKRNKQGGNVDVNANANANANAAAPARDDAAADIGREEGSGGGGFSELIEGIFGAGDANQQAGGRRHRRKTGRKRKGSGKSKKGRGKKTKKRRGGKKTNKRGRGRGRGHGRGRRIRRGTRRVQRGG